jgi:hypothetical protein
VVTLAMRIMQHSIQPHGADRVGMLLGVLILVAHNKGLETRTGFALKA